MKVFKQDAETVELTFATKAIISGAVSVVLLFATFVSGKIWTMHEDMSKLKADMSKWSAITDNREAVIELKIETEVTNRLLKILLGNKVISVDHIALPNPEKAPDRIKTFKRMYEQRVAPKSAK